MKKPFKKSFRTVLLAIVLLSGLCLAAAALSNLGLAEESAAPERLSEAEKARLAETIHLRQSLGDKVFPGFGQADIPLLVYNESHAFLVGFPDPPDGWQKIPEGQKRGGAWERVPGDDFMGEPYYRQRLAGPDLSPEAFTVQIGDRWAATLPTKEWLEIEFRNMLKSEIPLGLSTIAPYRLIIPLFIRGTDGYIAALSHESFHAYQGTAAEGKLESAERAVRQADNYPYEDVTFQNAWQMELELLVKALKSESDQEATQAAKEFMEQRERRRSAAGLSPVLVDYERQREWAEGQARYMELAIWGAAAAGPYQPTDGVQSIADFKQYSGYQNRWKQELDQMLRMAKSSGDGRFYYSGMAQAFLLDRLYPEWKNQSFENGTSLEGLLQTAVQ